MSAARPVKTAFIGLGAMGYPMAGHLQAAGHPTTVFNRTPLTAAQWCAEHGGNRCGTPAEAAAQADIVCVCVGNDDDVRSVVLGDGGVLEKQKPGSILIDHTTASAELARELQALCNDRGIAFLDAPVSGGQSGAQLGQLTIMVGGPADVFERANPILQSYGKSIQRMGAAGSGQLTKMVNQICIAGVLEGLSEALHFAERAGLETDAVITAISQGAAQSWQMDNRHETMARGEFDFGFAVDWMRKDLGIVLATAQHIGASLPMTALIDQCYGDIQNFGGGRWDTSSLIERLRKFSDAP